MKHGYFIFLCLAALMTLAACHPSTSPVPAPMVARFVAESPNNGEQAPRNECWMAGRFAGTATIRGGQLELMMSKGWIAVTRDNDKQWDDLHLVVELQGHPPSDVRWPPLTHSVPIVLRPTVDSAGPQLTTWQSEDTLRAFVPWRQVLGPRWLRFNLDYSTLSHAGQRSTCEGSLTTDTLRFR